MTQEHPQAAILRAIADGKQIQRNCSRGVWADVDIHTALHRITQGLSLRIKPETIMVNGVECPKPIPALCDRTNGIVRIEYGTAYIGQRTISSMLTFASEADARQVFDALVLPFKEAV